MFFRLWTRAPWTAMVLRAEAFVPPGLAFAFGLPFAFRLAFALEAIPIRWALEGKKGDLLHFDIALPGELHRRGGLADEPLVGQVLARRGDAADVEVPPEVVFDLGARPRLADLAEVLDHRREERRGALGQV